MRAYFILFMLVGFTLLSGFYSSRAEDSNEHLVPYQQIQVLDRNTDAEVSVERLFSVGTDSTKNYFFGTIVDIEILGDTLYVLDRALSRISKYNRFTGAFIDELLIVEGHGPGEMNYPANFCLDSNGSFYIISAGDMRLHIFDNTFSFHKSVQRFSYTDVSFQNNEIHMVHWYEHKHEKPLVEVINRDGELLTQYGKQHINLENNWTIDKLQGSFNVYMTGDNDYVYIAYGLPFEINIYTKANYDLVNTLTFNPKYYGGQYEGDIPFRWPTGLIVGIESLDDSTIVVFTMDIVEQKQYMNIIDINELTYTECELSTYNLGDLPILVKSAVSRDILYLASDDPYPKIHAMRITY